MHCRLMQRIQQTGAVADTNYLVWRARSAATPTAVTPAATTTESVVVQPTASAE